MWFSKKHTLSRIGQRLKKFFFFSVIAGALLFGGFLLWAATLDLPNFDLFVERKVAQSTKIYDRNGILLYDVYRDIKRTIVPFDHISPYIKNATVAIEDSEFYNHAGVRPMAFFRAMIVNIRAREFIQGGSTITQQVIKNSLLTPEKTPSRKVKEWILAVKLDRLMSKEEILALYLNESPYGGTIYGVEETAQAFFGKSAREVSLAEAAYLAALPQAPSYYSPYGSHREELEKRKNLVLSRMLELGFITKEEYQTAKEEVVEFLPIVEQSIKAPHFVFFIRDQLIETYGEDALSEQGLRVTTTLDYELQAKTEELVRNYVLEREDQFAVKNGALVAIDPRTGEILVMVGSRDYFDTENEGNFNVATAYRQPGSAFKPFVYAKAFEKGYTPDTVLFDLPTQFNANCDAFGKPLTTATPESACYMPENYDLVFRGPITLRNALAQSVNIPAIKTLYLAGIKDSIELTKRMGITGLEDPNTYGLTLVLGGGEVSLLDLTSAYSVFANDGKRNPYQGILKVEDSAGNILEEYTPNEAQVIEPEIARTISDILSDDDARAPAFGRDSFLSIPGKTIAVKTGTTNDYRDVWIVGYTPSLAVGVWMGNNNNTPMEKRVAGFIVAPLWNAFFKEYLKDKPDEPFPDPTPTPKNIKPILRGVWMGGQSFFVDRISGKLATALTPEEFREEKVVPDVHSILHWVNKNDPLGPIPSSPWNDPQYWLWETPVSIWAKQKSFDTLHPVELPNAYDDVHREEFIPKVTILSPVPHAQIIADEKVIVSLQATGVHPLKSADFFWNKTYLGSSNKEPFLFSFIPADVEFTDGGEHIIRVVVSDAVGNKKTEEVPVVVRSFNKTGSPE